MRMWKTVSWSIIAFLVTAVVGWMLTGDWSKGGWIAFLCRAIKFPAYYYHEIVFDWFAKPATVKAVETTQHWHEDFELESRRTVVAHCNAG